MGSISIQHSIQDCTRKIEKDARNNAYYGHERNRLLGILVCILYNNKYNYKLSCLYDSINLLFLEQLAVDLTGLAMGVRIVNF